MICIQHTPHEVSPDGSMVAIENAMRITGNDSSPERDRDYIGHDISIENQEKQSD